MSNARNLRSGDNCNMPNEQCIDQFISDVGEPSLVDLITETEDAMKEILLFILALIFLTLNVQINQKKKTERNHRKY